MVIQTKHSLLISIGFRGLKYKNRHGGIVLDDMDVWGRRSEMMKKGSEMARGVPCHPGTGWPCCA